MILYIWKQPMYWLPDTPLAYTEALRSGYGGGYNQFSRRTLILPLFLIAFRADFRDLVVLLTPPPWLQETTR